MGKNVLPRVYEDMISDPSFDPADASSFISDNLRNLIGAFMSEKRPLDELFEHMSAEDFASKYDKIMELVPRGYNPITGFLGKNDTFCRAAALLAQRPKIDPDDVVLAASPNTLTFDQALELEASATAVTKIVTRLTKNQAMKLLNLDGEAARAIGAKCTDLNLWTKIEYGIAPNETIRGAIYADRGRTLKHVETLFRRGLRLEALLAAEEEAFELSGAKYDNVTPWYWENYKLVLGAAKNKEEAVGLLLNFMFKIFLEADYETNQEEEDGKLISMARACVSLGFVTVDQATEFLFGIAHDIPSSRLNSWDYIREQLKL